jgi:hypothetical protein
VNPYLAERMQHQLGTNESLDSLASQRTQESDAQGNPTSEEIVPKESAYLPSAHDLKKDLPQKAAKITEVEGEDTDSMLDSFFTTDKIFIILTNSGKPIYSS